MLQYKGYSASEANAGGGINGCGPAYSELLGMMATGMILATGVLGNGCDGSGYGTFFVSPFSLDMMILTLGLYDKQVRL